MATEHNSNPLFHGKASSRRRDTAPSPGVSTNFLQLLIQPPSIVPHLDAGTYEFHRFL